MNSGNLIIVMMKQTLSFESFTMDVNKLNGENTQLTRTDGTEEDIHYFDRKISDIYQEIYVIKNRSY
ncbi:hypothetical protein CVD25_17720 [Bacillus canaveralius]|uniref:Uncharacterized protein n=1 Tax=Bacillus canaveralius TaxID=1403243 RepID=A0A2N5GG61_9BACI|nr:hypothetical protein CU635_21400 [Bacillus canaveralius]PLR93157.1 hypothetical protein CVD25_17720 [Bacillus canaveralius]